MCITIAAACSLTKVHRSKNNKPGKQINGNNQSKNNKLPSCPNNLHTKATMDLLVATRGVLRERDQLLRNGHPGIRLGLLLLLKL